MKFDELLQESPPPLPDSWDSAIFTSSIPFETRVEYAKQRVAHLGTGSSRIVFNTPYKGRKTALKIAKNNAGIAQNKVEAKNLFGMNKGFYKKLVIPMIDFDTKGFTWIHTEAASHFKSQLDFHRAIGFDMESMIDDMRFHGEPFVTHEPYTIKGNMLAHMIIEMTNDHNFLPLDLASYKNWGLYNGYPVIIDIGLDERTYDLYYSQNGMLSAVPV